MNAILAELAAPPAAWRRPALALGLLLLGIGLLYRETAVAMVGIWSRSDTFAHAFLVPPISLWLIWRGRDRLASLVPRPSLSALLPMALAAMAWLLGDLVATNAVTQFALVTLFVCSVPLVMGWRVTRVMLFPLLFLYFCVPVGEFLLPVLMEGTADFTVGALRLTGIPVYREGLQFVIPSGYWSVVEACSGVRYLIASLMVGSLFAYLNYQSLQRRLTFVAVSIVVPVVANWLRAYMIVMLGHLSNNRIATGVDHLVYGWVFFGIVITIMFVIGARWSEPDRPLEPPVPARGPAVGPGFGAVWPVLGAFALLALPHVVVAMIERQIATAPVQLAWPMPARGGWSLTPAPAPLQPRFEGASSQHEATYLLDGRAVGLYVAYYRGQGPDRKLISSQNVLVSSSDSAWNPISTSTHTMTVDQQALVWRATHLVGRTGGIGAPRTHMTVWQAYWVDGALTSNDVVAKLRAARGLLAGRGDDGAAVVLYVAGEPDSGGHAALSAFTQAHLPELQQALARARSAR